MFGPPLLSAIKFHSIVRSQTKEDVAATAAPLASVVQIVSNALPTGRRPSREPKVLCNEICQRLLYNGDVKTLILTYRSFEPRHGEPRSTTYFIKRMKVCPKLMERNQSDPLTPAVNASIAAGICLVAEDGEKAVPHLTLTDESKTRGLFPSGHALDFGSMEALADRLSARRITASVGDKEGSGKVVYRQTMISGWIIATPFFFGPGSGSMGERFEIMRRREIFNEVNLEIAFEKLGYDVAPYAFKPDWNALAWNILNLPVDSYPELTMEQQETLGEAAKAMSKWPMKTNKAPLSADDVKLLRAMVRDPRITVWHVFKQAARSLPEDAYQGLLPGVLDRLEKTEPDLSSQDIVHFLGEFLAKFPAEMLRAEKERIFALARKTHRTGQTYRTDALRGIVFALWKIGDDALPTLEFCLRSPEWSIRDQAAIALCMLESPKAIPALREALTENRGRRADSQETHAMARALIRLGDKEAVREFVAGDERLQKRYQRALSLEPGFPAKRCR